jgi:hypothetical protein
LSDVQTHYPFEVDEKDRITEYYVGKMADILFMQGKRASYYQKVPRQYPLVLTRTE